MCHFNCYRDDSCIAMRTEFVASGLSESVLRTAPSVVSLSDSELSEAWDLRVFVSGYYSKQVLGRIIRSGSGLHYD
jgi:hypothetical protein